MKMKNVQMVIGKIQKGYELVPKTRDIRIHIEEETLCHEHAFNIFKTLVWENYYDGKQHKFMGISKSELDKDFAFLTLTKKKTNDTVFEYEHAYNH